MNILERLPWPAAPVIGAVIALASCGGNARTPAPGAAPAGGPATVDVVRVVERPLAVSRDMPGELEANETVDVYSRVPGFVRTIPVDRGSRVRKGQVLALLDAPELLSQRAEAQSRVHAAEAQLGAVRAKAQADAGTYDKLKAASATPGAVAGNDLALAQKAADADRDQVAAAEQGAEAARQALKSITQMEDYLRITAPFDGIVTERRVHPGALVGPGSGAAATPLLRVVNDRRLRLVVPVPEAFAGDIAEGTSVPFTVQAFPGEVFSGRVSRVAHALDVKTRTMAVELDVDNLKGRLSPGSYCQVKWPVRRSGPSLLVPAGSVASTTDRVFVVRIRGNKAEWVDVKTGVTSGPLVEVFGALHPGDEVAVRGTDELRQGTDVRPKDVSPPS